MDTSKSPKCQCQTRSGNGNGLDTVAYVSTGCRVENITFLFRTRWRHVSDIVATQHRQRSKLKKRKNKGNLLSWLHLSRPSREYQRRLSDLLFCLSCVAGCSLLISFFPICFSLSPTFTAASRFLLCFFFLLQPTYLQRGMGYT